MDTEVKRLEALLEACHDVLSALGDREDEIAEAIRGRAGSWKRGCANSMWVSLVVSLSPPRRV